LNRFLALAFILLTLPLICHAQGATLVGGPAALQTLISHCGGQFSGSTNGIATVDTCNVTTGQLIVADCSNFDGGTGTHFSSVVDTIGNTFIHIAAADASDGLGDTMDLWYVVSTGTNATDTITCSIGTNVTFLTALGRVYSNVPALPLDVGAQGFNASSVSTLTSNAFTTTNATDIVVAFSRFSINNTYTAGLIDSITAGNVFGTQAPGSALAAGEDANMYSVQTGITATMSGTVSHSCVMSVAAFK
jgi:hypothetical protein